MLCPQGVNKDSYLILETLPTEYDSRVKAMEVDERPTEQYSDIGGLDKQIQEVRGARRLTSLLCFSASVTRALFPPCLLSSQHSREAAGTEAREQFRRPSSGES